MAQTNIVVPYEEYNKLKSDAEAKNAALEILGATFTSDVDKMTALKAVLGFEEPTP